MNSSIHPASKKAIRSRKRRLLKVYWVATRIGLSYGWFKLKTIVRGKDWARRHIPPVHLRNARRAEKTIGEVRGLFVKLGQLLSILTNFLPKSFRDGLQGVQDQIPPRPSAEVIASIERELGKPPEILFAEFDATPLASASLAQVHLARLHDGTQVAVKVRHLDIEAVATLDLRAFRRILKVVAWIFKVKGMDHAYRQIEEMILEELDFAREADYLCTISKQFEGVEKVAFPRLIEAFSSSGIMTTTFEQGLKITDLDTAAAQGLDRKAIAQRILDAYCQMLFQNGVFHADPHPGNLLIRPDGTVVFIDFGAIGHLSPTMKAGIPRFLEAVLSRNETEVGRILVELGFVNTGEDQETIGRTISYFQRRFLENIPIEDWRLKDFKFDLQTKLEVFAELKDLDVSMRDLARSFQIPKDWVILHRTLLLLLGLVSHIDPEMNPIFTIRPYLKHVVLDKGHNWKGLATGVLRDMLLSAFTLPADIKKLAEKAHSGDLEVQISGYQQRTQLLRSLGRQALFSLFTISSTFLAYFAFHHGHSGIAAIATKVGIVSGLCLAFSLLFARK